MNKEIADLVSFYFEKTNTRSPNIYYRTQIFKDFERLVQSGFTISSIRNAISIDPYNYEQVLKKSNNKDNLINLNKFYYHPFLQIVPSPPTITINNDGTFTESYSNDKFFLQLKTSITFQDILKYFYKKFYEVRPNEKRDLGAIKHIYEKNIAPAIELSGDNSKSALDLLLFTIDTARTYTYDDDQKLSNGVLGLTHYIDHALTVYEEKMNYCKLNGLTYVQ